MQMGTFEYMAPELMGYSSDASWRSQNPVTKAVDIYSFAVLLWEILTGEVPNRFQRRLREPR